MKYIEYNYKTHQAKEIEPTQKYLLSPNEFYNNFLQGRKNLEINTPIIFENVQCFYAIEVKYLLVLDKINILELKYVDLPSMTEIAIRLTLMKGPCIRCCLYNEERTECVCKNECDSCYEEEKCTCEEQKAKQLDDFERSTSIFCRSCGPGGTRVTVRAQPEGMRAVWTHEDLPYLTDVNNIKCYCDPKNIGEYEGCKKCYPNNIVTADEDNAASDQHNVSWLTYQEMDRILTYAKKKGWHT